MKYSEQLTKSLKLSQQYPESLQNIKDIVKKDIKKTNWQKINNDFVFVNEVAINLDILKKNCIDEVGEEIKGVKSVDLFFCIIDDFQEEKIILVELKLDCNGIVNISNECKDKVSDSMLLLFGTGIPIENEYIFVYNDDFLLKNEIKSLLKKILKNPYALVLTLSELKKNYFT